MSEAQKNDRYTCTVHDPERVSEFIEVFGTATLPIVSPIAVLGHGARLEGISRFYMLDLDQISEETQERLYEHLSRKFRAPVKEVRRDIESRGGLPILAEQVSLCVTNLRFLL